RRGLAGDRRADGGDAALAEQLGRVAPRGRRPRRDLRPPPAPARRGAGPRLRRRGRLLHELRPRGGGRRRAARTRHRTGPPRAPEQDAVGRDAYALASRTFLGTSIDIDETYAWGIEELRSVVAEQEEVAARINARAGNGAGRSVEAAKQALDADPSRVLHGTE